MIVGLISDTHGLLRPEALAALEGSEHVIHAGDIGDGAILEALSRIAPVTAVRGNNDTQPWARGVPETQTVELAGVRVHVIHDLAALAPHPARVGTRVVVAGHSHVPRVEERDGVLYVNPGSAGPRRFTLPVSVGQLAIEPDRVTARLRELAGGGKPARQDGAPRECTMRLDRASLATRIAPIDLARDAARCIAFRRESYVATFGTDAGMDGEMGTDGALYLHELGRRMAQVPEGNVHLWRGGEIVGQAEMRLVEDDAGMGYVNLFYVVPGERGRGLGRALHEHAVAVFRARGMRAMRLSVSERNGDALEFYRRLGWIHAGTRPHRVPMAVLEFPITAGGR